MKRKIIVLIILFFLQGIITNIGHPVTSFYITDLGIPDYMFGFFLAVMSLGTMLGAPFWGNLGDRNNKRNLIILGILIYSLGQFLFGLRINVGFLLTFRFISGIGIAASTTLLTSEMIISSPPNKRARGIAYAAAALTLGGSSGYFLGGFINNNQAIINILKTDNFSNVFFVQAILGLLFAILLYFIFKPIEIVIDESKKRAQFWEGFSDIKYLSKDLIIFLLALALISTAASNVDKFLDPFFKISGLNSGDVGNFKLVVGFVSVFASIALVPIFSKFKNKLGLMAIFQILSAIIVFITFRMSNFLLAAYTILMVYIMIKAIFQPIEQEYISTYAKNDEVGKIVGVRQSFLSVGTIVGQSFGALLFGKSPLLLFNSSVIIFILSVGLIFISALTRKKQSNNNIIV